MESMSIQSPFKFSSLCSEGPGMFPLVFFIYQFLPFILPKLGHQNKNNYILSTYLFPLDLTEVDFGIPLA